MRDAAALAALALACAFACARAELHPHNVRIAIAPLPSYFNLDLAADDRCGVCEEDGTDLHALFAAPLPLGPRLANLSAGLAVHFVSQYALEALFAAQLARSELLVNSSAEADIVYVPFFPQFAWPCFCGERHARVAAEFAAALPRLLPGADARPHFLVNGMMDAFSPLKPEAVPALSVLSVERAAPPRRFWFEEPEDARWGPAAVGAIGVPYPGAVVRRARAPLAREPQPGYFRGLAARKRWLVAATFLPRYPLREALRAQCAARPGQCRFTERVTEEKGVLGGSARAVVAALAVTGRAWFCLQPHGDTPSRQGWYDCLGMGAIPVLFDAAQLEMFPFQHALNPAEFTAFVPRALTLSEGFNVVDYLGARYPVRQRRRMLERLHAVQHGLLYAEAPLAAASLRFGDGLGRLADTDDAFTMALKTLVWKLCAHGRLPRARCHPASAAQMPNVR